MITGVDYIVTQSLACAAAMIFVLLSFGINPLSVLIIFPTLIVSVRVYKRVLYIRTMRFLRVRNK
jgi:hypothetical protein